VTGVLAGFAREGLIRWAGRKRSTTGNAVAAHGASTSSIGLPPHPVPGRPRAARAPVSGRDSASPACRLARAPPRPIHGDSAAPEPALSAARSLSNKTTRPELCISSTRNRSSGFRSAGRCCWALSPLVALGHADPCPPPFAGMNSSPARTRFRRRPPYARAEISRPVQPSLPALLRNPDV
jgi:hypothetical protein